MNVPNSLEQVYEFLKNGGLMSIMGYGERDPITNPAGDWIYKFGFQLPGEEAEWYRDTHCLGLRPTEIVSDPRFKVLDREHRTYWKDILLADPQPKPKRFDLVDQFDLIDTYARIMYTPGPDADPMFFQQRRDEIEPLISELRQREVRKLRDLLDQDKILLFADIHDRTYRDWLGYLGVPHRSLDPRCSVRNVNYQNMLGYDGDDYVLVYFPNHNTQESRGRALAERAKWCKIPVVRIWS